MKILKFFTCLIFILLLIFTSCNKPKIFLNSKTICLRKKIELKRRYLVTSPQRILLIGDSMAYFLGFRLNDYCEKNKDDMYLVTWVSATTKVFAQSDTIQYFINQFSPTYIIFVIGSNELFYYDLDARRQYVKEIIKQIGDIHSIWVGPPNWKEDTGINNIMMSEVGEKRFFLSKNLTFERQSGADVHPSRKSSEMWFDSIAHWIVKKSDFPIKLDTPEYKSKNEIKFKTLKLRTFKRKVEIVDTV